MTDLRSIGIAVRSYKCFGEEAHGYDSILPINLIIGRNNSGKSTLLDIVDYVTVPKDLNHLGHKGNPPKFMVSDVLDEEYLSRVFPKGAAEGLIPGNHWDFGKQLIGHRLTWELSPNSPPRFRALVPALNAPNVARVASLLVSGKKSPLEHFVFRRLLADRDIRPEAHNQVLELKTDGSGFTNVIQNYINRADLPSSLVERDFLDHLNKIIEPDAYFTDIVVQLLENNAWEVYLEEESKGRIPLSHTGSGLKTILLVLAYLHLLPVIERKPLDRYLFGLEELENNLHPALQRRLLLYLRDQAINAGCHFFVTTHSNVAIDLYSNDPDAQILHVTHDRRCASVRCVRTYVENRGIIDDLDVRASDLLQSNGIVWVEGPSDRLYFNRWVQIWSEGALREGTHYQCVFYGGRLLAHLSARDPDVNTEDVVKILRVNANALLLIDSDRASSEAPINETKSRIIREIRDVGGIAWLTAGREVENYLPHEVITQIYQRNDLPKLQVYQKFADYLDSIESGDGNRFLRSKVMFAERAGPLITRSGLERTLDMAALLDGVCAAIMRWNGLHGSKRVRPNVETDEGDPT